MADDPDSFKWINYAGSVPANAVTAYAGSAPFCRLWAETDTTRGVDAGVFVNGSCHTLQFPGGTTGAVQILTGRSADATCSDAIVSWPQGASPDAESCEGEYTYTPACYQIAQGIECGVASYIQEPVYGTCQTLACGVAGFQPTPSTKTDTVVPDCAELPVGNSLCRPVYNADCLNDAKSIEAGLIGGPSVFYSGPQLYGEYAGVDSTGTKILCDITYYQPIYKSCQNVACGVVGSRETPVYNSCRRASHGLDTPQNCQSTPQYTARGFTRTIANHFGGASTGYPAPSCMTGENFVDDNAPDINAKFKALYANYLTAIGQGSTRVGIGSEDGTETAAAIVRNLKILFEIHGDALTDPATRAFVRSLYTPALHVSGTLARCAPETTIDTPGRLSMPTVISRAPGVLDVFYNRYPEPRLPSSTPQVNVRELMGGQWGPPVNLGGDSPQRAGATSWGFAADQGRFDVFVAGRTGLLHEWYVPPQSHWEAVHGGGISSGPVSSSGIASVPVPASFGAGQYGGGGNLSVFYLGTDHALKVRTATLSASAPTGTGPFSVATNLGGKYQGDPAAVESGAAIDVFVRSATNTLVHQSWNGSSWLAAEDLGGTVMTSPAVASWRGGHLDVFWGGADGMMHHRMYDSGLWQAEENLGVPLISDPAAASWEPGRVDVISVDVDGQTLIHRAFMDGRSGASNPADCTWLDSTSDVLCGKTTADIPACRGMSFAAGDSTTTNGYAPNVNDVSYEADVAEIAVCNALALQDIPAVVAAEVDQCEAAIGRLSQAPPACAAGANAALSINLVKTALSVPLDASSPANLQTDLSARLGHVQAWWLAQPYASRDAAQAGQLVALIWKPLYALVQAAETSAQSAAAAGSTANANVAMGDLLHALAAQATNLLDAAFPPPPAIPPLTGAPLGYVLSDALEPLVERLEQLGAFQDLACRYAQTGCSARTTALIQLWHEIADLGNPTSLAQDVAAATSVTDPWKTAFANLSAQYGALTSAATDAMRGTAGSPSGTWSSTSATQPPSFVELAKLVQAGAQRVGAYSSIGQIELGPTNVIYTGLTPEKQSSLLQQVQAKLAVVNTGLSNYAHDQTTLLTAILADMQNQQGLTSLTNKLLADSQQFQNEQQAIAALKASRAMQDAQFGDFMGSFNSMVSSGAFAGNTLIQHNPTQPVVLNVTGAAAQFKQIPAQHVSDLALKIGGAPWVQAAQPGEVLNIAVTGKYAPSCALSKSKLPDGSSPSIADLYSGPEGYALTYTGTAYSVSTQQTVDSQGSSTTSNDQTCSGYNAQGGVGWNYIVDVGVTGTQTEQQCGDQQQSRSFTQSSIQGSTSENRTAASFAAGIHLSDTPFPFAPAGSLLLVQTDAQQNILDVRVVSPQSAVVVDKASQYYLLINDDGTCPSYDTTQALTVSISHLVPVGALVQALGQAMATSYATIRNQVGTLENQAQLEPDEGALLRTQAYTELRKDCGCDPATYPSALMGLFDTWLNSEIVRMEREVALGGLQRQAALTLLDMQANKDDLAANGQQGRIAAQVPDWTIFNLDSQVLGSNAQSLATLVAKYLYPAAVLRYPTVFSDLAIDTTAQMYIAQLLSLSWDSPIESLVAAEAELVNAIATAHQNAVNNTHETTQDLPNVALSVPNPASTVKMPSLYRTLDSARSQSIWTALTQSLQPGKSVTPVTITLTPDDLYSLHDGNSLLACTQAAPVITAMALYVGEPDTTFEVLNGAANLRLPTTVGSTMEFPISSATGGSAESFLFQNPTWLSSPLSVYFGTEQDSFTPFTQNLSANSGMAGLSPFATFTIDPTALINEQGHPLATATELVLLLQLYTAPAAAPGLTYMPACQ